MAVIVRSGSSTSGLRRPSPPAYAVDRPFSPEMTGWLQRMGLSSPEIGQLQRQAGAREVWRQRQPAGGVPQAAPAASPLSGEARQAVEALGLLGAPLGRFAPFLNGLNLALGMFIPWEGETPAPVWSWGGASLLCSGPWSAAGAERYIRTVAICGELAAISNSWNPIYPGTWTTAPVPPFTGTAAKYVKTEGSFHRYHATIISIPAGAETPGLETLPAPRGVIVLPNPFAQPQEAGGPPRVGWRLAAMKANVDTPVGRQAGYAAPQAGGGLQPPPRGPRGNDLAGAREGELEVIKHRSPGRYAKERKFIAPYGAVVALQKLGAATEFKDLVDALWQSLPNEIRREARQMWVEGYFAAGGTRPPKVPPMWVKIAAVLGNWDVWDGDAMVRELLADRIEDMVYGRVGKMVGRRVGKMTGNPSPTFSPQNEHPLAPELPLDGILDRIRNRDERRSVQSNSAVVRQRVIDEQARRRRNVIAETRRRAAYRRNIGK